jgi:hypothetical protein
MPRASMSRFLLARRAHLAGVLSLGLLGSLLFAGSTPAHPGSGSRLRVTEVEYRLALSRDVVQAGPFRLEVIDGGMDPHDLRLRAVGSKQQIASPELTPGHSWDDVVDLEPGVYRLWCSLPEHARLGMHTTLRVVR